MAETNGGVKAGGDVNSADAIRVLVIGGSPEVASPETVRRAAFGCAAVVAVDRGLDAALAAGVPCDLFCGDGDSVGECGGLAVEAAEERARLTGGQDDVAAAMRRCGSDDEALDGPDEGDGVCEQVDETVSGFLVERYHPHKDATDLELALDAVAERWPGAQLRVTCLAGGAPDHFLAVMGRLAHWQGGGTGEPSVEICEDGFEGRILHASEAWRIVQARDQRFSFVALSPEAVVSEEGMRWNLDHRRVELLGDLGISNVIDEPEARFTCHEGTVAAFLFDGYFAGA